MDGAPRAPLWVVVGEDLGAGRRGRCAKTPIFHRNVNTFYSSSMRFVSGQVSSQLKLVRLQHEHIIVSNQISMIFTFSSAAGDPLASLQVTMSIFSWEIYTFTAYRWGSSAPKFRRNWSSWGFNTKLLIFLLTSQCFLTFPSAVDTTLESLQVENVDIFSNKF